MKKEFSLFVIIVLVLCAAGLFVVARDLPRLHSQNQNDSGAGMGAGSNMNDRGDSGNDSIACTMDAKMCPDGSYVGRTGPRCEFAPCPKGM